MKQIMNAISSFEKECPVIENLVDGYGYTYTDLKGLFAIIKPLLEKNDLMHVFTMDANWNLTLTIYHSSGELITSTAPILQGVSLVKMNAFQVVGAGISYMKRYMIISALGIITTDQCADACQADNQPPASTEGRDVRSAHTKKPITGKQIDNGDLL